MPRLIHPIAGVIAMLTIATFLTATILSELFGSAATVAEVKTAIAWGLLLLVPAVALTGGSGVIRAKGRRAGLVGVKLKRMRIIAANGVVVLVPAALFLAWKAASGEFDATFYAAQALELAAGATNLALLGLSMRDGLKMTGRLRPAARGPRTNGPRPVIAESTAALHPAVR